MTTRWSRSGSALAAMLLAAAMWSTPGPAVAGIADEVTVCTDGTISKGVACRTANPSVRTCPGGTMVDVGLPCPKSAAAACAAAQAKAYAKLTKALTAIVFNVYNGSTEAQRAAAQRKISAAVDKFSAAWALAEKKAAAAGGGCPRTDEADQVVADAAEAAGLRVAEASGRPYRDQGDGTIVDRLLQWEKKSGADGVPNALDPHDVDNTYTWSFLVAPDGTAFSDFLAKLNGEGGSCFAGQCDWRLPTVAELQELRLGVFPDCEYLPCIEPLFIPVSEQPYWSLSPWDDAPPGYAQTVEFGFGATGHAVKTSALPVRAVRRLRRDTTCSGAVTLCPDGTLLAGQCSGSCPATKVCPGGTVVASDANCPKNFVGKCAASIYKAQAKLESATQYALFSAYLSGDLVKADGILRAQVTKFEDAVEKAHRKAVAAGSSCPSTDDVHTIVDQLLGGSFERSNQLVTTAAGTRWVETADDTILDRKTGLEWEKKTALDGNPDGADVHDADRTFARADLPPGSPLAVTSFLAELNGGSGPCYAGKCDWRLPTRDELRSLGFATCPANLPCVDPIFSPIAPGPYWTATGFPDIPVSRYFAVDPSDNTAAGFFPDEFLHVRAVRGDGTLEPPRPTTTTSTTTTTTTSTTLPILCGASNKCVFLTSSVFAADFGGLAGGDAICNAAASARGLPGTYVAWLSTSSTDAITRLTASGPYHLVDGTLVASNPADLTDGTLAHAIDTDEWGNVVPLREVWTGTGPNGTSSDGTCNDWTSSSGTGFPFGVVGWNTVTNDDWTEVFIQFCDRNDVSLYCFQQ